jgi:dimethylargininase
LANRKWLDIGPLSQFRIVDVAAGEERAANVLCLGGSVIVPDSFPRTAEILAREGLCARAIAVSELMKAEAGVTCCSLLFESTAS